MKVVLLRVGIDTGTGGIHGPLLQDGTFEYVPIRDGDEIDERTYGNTLGRHGRCLSEYFPASRQAVVASYSMHVDPEFETFTYGDPTAPKAGLRHLTEGDLLVFYCGLKGWGDCSVEPRLFVMGYFEVAAAGRASDFSAEEVDRLFARNYHVRHRKVFAEQRERLVLVKGSPESRLLKKATCISEPGRDRSGKPLKVLSREGQQVFGDFGGHLSLQRSPPRWVDPSFVGKAAGFVRSLG